MRVVPDVAGLDKHFDYVVPTAMADRVQVGSMVRVLLHGRRVGGWVTEIGPSTEVAPDRLVPIAKWSGHGPDADLIDLARWAGPRWGTTRLRPFLVTASPPSMVTALPPPSRSSHPRALAGRAVDPVADAVLDGGGGVMRLPPADDVVPTLLTAARLGPILVVHPSIDGARSLAARLRQLGFAVALHPEQWALAAAGADVVVGTRAATWAPCPGVRAIVVVDEHDEALQEERSPTWHARDVAIERARRAGVPCLLVSPSPSVTALHWAGRRVGRPAMVDEHAGWPVVEVVDRGEEEAGRRSLLSSSVIQALRDRDRRVVCVLNTTGRARLLSCRSCRSIQRCERCDAAVAQRDDRVLECRRCGTTRPPVCPVCGSSALGNVRPGLTRAREEIEAAAGRPVVAVSGAHAERAVDDGAEVFVGTEAVLHRVGRADLVAFLDLDGELLAPRYRAGEQAMALLVRAARLLGPRARGGRLVLQTHVPDHEVIQAVLHTDPTRLARADAARRRDLQLPPFAAIAALTGPGAAELAEATGLTWSGSGEAVLIRAATWDDLGPTIASTPRPRGANVRVEVDPPRR